MVHARARRTHYLGCAVVLSAFSSLSKFINSFPFPSFSASQFGCFAALFRSTLVSTDGETRFKFWRWRYIRHRRVHGHADFRRPRNDARPPRPPHVHGLGLGFSTRRRRRQWRRPAERQQQQKQRCLFSGDVSPRGILAAAGAVFGSASRRSLLWKGERRIGRLGYGGRKTERATDEWGSSRYCRGRGSARGNRSWLPRWNRRALVAERKLKRRR